MSLHALSPASLVSRLGLTLRAALGGLLVTLALLGVSQAYAHADRPPRSGVVVVDRDLPPGTTLASDHLEVLAVDLPPPLADRVFDRPEVLEGATTLAPLAAGEPVLLSQVLPAGVVPDAGVDLSFAVSADRALGGLLQPGERVDLVATPAAGATRVVAEGVTVIDAVSDTEGLLADGGGLVVTTRLPSRRVLVAVVAAVDQGRLTLARTAADEVG